MNGGVFVAHAYKRFVARRRIGVERRPLTGLLLSIQVVSVWALVSGAEGQANQSTALTKRFLNRRLVGGIGFKPLFFIRRRRRVRRISMRNAFLSGIVKDFIRFLDGITQGRDFSVLKSVFL